MNDTFMVPCLMGVEGLVADELKFGGFFDVRAENARVYFKGDAQDCARANVTLRCGERVLLSLGSFKAESFEALFEGVYRLPWEARIGKSDAFPVKGFSRKSQLFSVPDCQRIIKKAAAKRLGEKYGLSTLPETGVLHQIQFSIMDDICEVFLDTTGAPLYKRGYKLEQNDATLRETLAASLVKIARYKGREPFFDPFCGAGTIAIEAAQAALSIAPGLERAFDGESWPSLQSAFQQVKEEARGKMRKEKLPIYASDLMPREVETAKENARRAGVLDCIEFSTKDALKSDWAAQSGTLITNPPYGVRLLDQKQAQDIYRAFGAQAADNLALKKYILSPMEDFEGIFGRRADKKRKLYNGMLKCNLYMYYR